MNHIERLKKITKQADSKEQDRIDYQKFIALMCRVHGWTEACVAEYRELVSVLMGKDDAKALALYEDGLFSSAEEARQSARDFWKSKVAA